jgi:hypothetical protein
MLLSCLGCCRVYNWSEGWSARGKSSVCNFLGFVASRILIRASKWVTVDFVIYHHVPQPQKIVVLVHVPVLVLATAFRIITTHDSWSILCEFKKLEERPKIDSNPIEIIDHDVNGKCHQAGSSQFLILRFFDYQISVKGYIPWSVSS